MRREIKNVSRESVSVKVASYTVLYCLFLQFMEYSRDVYFSNRFLILRWAELLKHPLLQ